MTELLAELRHNRLLWLLVFVPAVLVVHSTSPEAHTLQFLLSVLAAPIPRSSLATVLDLLRNEGPIELRWAGPFDTRLSTALEPVGEGE